MKRKHKKHSGWCTPQIHQKINQSEMIENALGPTPMYDDWED